MKGQDNLQNTTDKLNCQLSKLAKLTDNLQRYHPIETLKDEHVLLYTFISIARVKKTLTYRILQLEFEAFKKSQQNSHS